MPGSRKKVVSTRKNKKETIDKAKNTGWECLKCTKEVDDEQDCIECHYCKEWCHRSCSKLSLQEFEILTRGGEHIIWRCTVCIEEEVVKDKKTKSLESKIDNMTKMIENLVARLDTVEGDQGKRLSKLEELVQVNKKPETTTSIRLENLESKVDIFLNENQQNEEKQKRKLNVVVVNLPESDKESPEDRVKDDKERLRKIVSEIKGVEPEDVDNPLRLGHFKIGQNVRPRLIKIECRSEEAKNLIMKGTWSLNKKLDKDKRVYFNNDLTSSERELLQKVKVDFNKRKKEGETDIRIDYKNLQIVKIKNLNKNNPPSTEK